MASSRRVTIGSRAIICEKLSAIVHAKSDRAAQCPSQKILATMGHSMGQVDMVGRPFPPGLHRVQGPGKLSVIINAKFDLVPGREKIGGTQCVTV